MNMKKLIASIRTRIASGVLYDDKAQESVRLYMITKDNSTLITKVMISNTV